jgi:hypothetical protein
MDPETAPRLVWAAVFIVFMIVVGVSAFQKRGGRRAAPGPGAYGTIYDLLNEDKRNAIELIVEQKAEARDPETADDVMKPPHAHLRSSNPGRSD